MIENPEDDIPIHGDPETTAPTGRDPVATSGDDAVDVLMLERLSSSMRREVNSIAVVSLVLAVAGFCGLFMFYIGLPFAIGAVVCGWIGLRRSRHMGGDGRRTSIIGLALGASMTVASVAGIIVLLSGGSSG